MPQSDQLQQWRDEWRGMGERERDCWVAEHVTAELVLEKSGSWYTVNVRGIALQVQGYQKAIEAAGWMGREGIPRYTTARDAIARAEEAVGRMGLGNLYAYRLRCDLVADAFLDEDDEAVLALITATPEQRSEALYLAIRQHKENR